MPRIRVPVQLKRVFCTRALKCRHSPAGGLDLASAEEFHSDDVAVECNRLVQVLDLNARVGEFHASPGAAWAFQDSMLPKSGRPSFLALRTLVPLVVEPARWSSPGSSGSSRGETRRHMCSSSEGAPVPGCPSPRSPPPSARGASLRTCDGNRPRYRSGP